MYTGIPLIDLDVFVYRAGFASEGEPESHARYTVKRMLEQVIDKFDRGLSYRGFLTASDKSNYRFAVAKEAVYKGNRADSKKPQHYDVVREYLIKWWKAEVIQGKEADDALGCAQTDETCIVSIDKDLLMIPGAHYNFVKDEYKVITEQDGWKNFYTQLLTGDRTDNICGVKGIGPKTAAKILAACKSKSSLHKTVTSVYKEHYGSKATSLMKERGALLWIQREPGVVWSP